MASAAPSTTSTSATTAASSSATYGFVLRPVTSKDIDAIYDLEKQSYPADEAASLEGLQFRAKNAGNYFRAVYLGTELIGFICGTCTEATSLDHDSMSSHKEGGATLCIHSVVTAPKWRRQGLATWMMCQYLRQMGQQSQLRVAALIAKLEVTPLYAKCGFLLVGKSAVVHGKDPWFEMRYQFSSTPQYPVFQADAFTDKPFAGNPAGLVVLSPRFVAEDDVSGLPPDEWMQNVGMEMSLAETAFVRPLSDGRYRIRWFTPGCEVDLCGHATLAACALLWQHGFVPRCQESIHLVSNSGPLSAKKVGGDKYQLDFPSAPPKAVEYGSVAFSKAQIATSIGVTQDDLLFVGTNQFDIYVEVTPVAFAALKPDYRLIKALGTRGLDVTAKAADDAGHDFESRFFAPQSGVDEDPVTGSAHCALAPYWAAKLGKTTLLGKQCSPRTGLVEVEVAAGDRVLLRGHVVSFFAGRLTAAV